MDERSDRLDLAAEFARISEELRAQPASLPTLERIVELAVETIEPCDACGVSLQHLDGNIETPACTSDMVQKADALQYECGEGPCLDAIWNLDTYLINDMSTESRWPRWAPAAASLGVGSVLSLKLDTDGHVEGGLNLYSYKAHVFGLDDVATASIFARHAAVALEDAQRVEGLQTALRSRQTIGIAQGMLMQRYKLTLDQSFEVLRRFSQNRNVKLRVLAEQLVRDGSVTDLSTPVEQPAEPDVSGCAGRR